MNKLTKAFVVTVYTLAALALTMLALGADAASLRTDTRVDDTTAIVLGLNNGFLIAQADTAPVVLDAGTSPEVAPAAAPADAPEVPVQAALDLLNIVQTKKGGPGYVWLLVAGALRLLVQVLRWGGRKLPGKAGVAVGNFVDHPLAAYLMPSVLALIGGIATSVASGGSWFSMDVLNTAIQIGLGAVGLYVGEKKFKEAFGKGKAATADPGPTLNA